MDAGQLVAVDRPLHQVAEVLLHALGRHLVLQHRQQRRMARDQADVGGVALVAAAPEARSARAARSCAGRRAARPAAVASGSGATWGCGGGSVTANVVSPSVTVGVTCSFGNEPGELPQHRRHRGAAARAGGARRPRGAGCGELAAEHLQRAPVGMRHRQAQHDFARRQRPGMRPVGGLGAEQLDVRGQEVREPALAQQPAAALEQRLAGALRLRGGIDADDGELPGHLEARLRRRADLVGAGRWAAAGAGHEHAMRPGLFHAHLAEVADHVRQQVAGRIADLVQQLLADRRRRDEPAGPRRLGDDEAAVFAALDDRIADVGPVGHARPSRCASRPSPGSRIR